MTIEQLTKYLIKAVTVGKMSPSTKILVSSDEEWNTLFDDVVINQDTETGALVIFGLSGSEITT